MRVTANMSQRSTMRDLNVALERLQDAQRRLSSGKTNERVSDDPRAATDVMFLRQQLGRMDQTERTRDDTKSRLEVADSTLLSASDLLGRARELAIRAANTGANDQNSRAAIETELRALREEGIGLANTEFLGRSIFGGTTVTSAYDEATGGYLGDDVVQQRTVDDGVTVAANLTGPQVFGDPAGPGGDVFAVLDRLADAVRDGDNAAMAVEQGRLDQAKTQIGNGLAEVGRRVAQLDELDVRTDVRKADLQERLSEIEDVDLAEAIVQSQNQENAYQAALAAVARSSPPSLIQFLN
ncbi:MAG: flagellar hook-associated protein FlgL [Actinomycetota bacterium]